MKSVFSLQPSFVSRSRIRGMNEVLHFVGSYHVRIRDICRVQKLGGVLSRNGYVDLMNVYAFLI